MTAQEPTGPYVYQPFGSHDRKHWDAGRLWAVGGLPSLAKVEGLTKPEAEAIVEALRQVNTP